MLIEHKHLSFAVEIDKVYLLGDVQLWDHDPDSKKPLYRFKVLASGRFPQDEDLLSKPFDTEEEGLSARFELMLFINERR